MHIIDHILIYTFLYDCYFCITSITIIGYVGFTAINIVNKLILNMFDNRVLSFKNNLNIDIHKSVKQLTEEHNQFCRSISEYNRFWSRIYFTYLCTIVPINLIWLHQFFFEQVDELARLFIGFVSIVLIFRVFFKTNTQNNETIITTPAETQWMAVSFVDKNQINHLFREIE